MIAAGGAVWQWWPPAATSLPGPEPFVNSLGQRFVPGGTPGVLFCTTETRVRDFAAYVTARGLTTFPAPMWVNYAGGERTWQTVLASWQDPGFPQTDEDPVVGITQHEAKAFCEWLTEHERASGRIGPGDRYRLPTNAEWSVAAGLDADTLYPSGIYPWGTGFPPRAPSGNFASEEVREAKDGHVELAVLAGYRDGHAFTAPVGSFAANARALYDLGGNAWEWTDDNTGERGTLRGGSWGDTKADKLDVAVRVSYEPGLRSYTVGFRAVLARKIAATSSDP
jgi:formylglycine-generating enzyme required for sulfatase activity